MNKRIILKLKHTLITYQLIILVGCILVMPSYSVSEEPEYNDLQLKEESAPPATIKYKGELKFEHWTFPKEAGGSNQTNSNNTVELKVEGLFEVDFFSILIAPRIKEDFSERGRNRLLLDEGWMQFTTDYFDLRIGIQQFTWGMVESQKLVDILNQKDYEADFLDPDKFGELSARLRFFLIEQTAFEFYYLTNFTKATFPSKKGRYNFTNGLYDISDNVIYASSDDEWYPQYAFRLNTTIKTIDLALSYFHGYNRFPTIDFTTGQPYYYVLDQGGLEFTWVIERFIVKLEGVYRNTSRQPETSSIPKNLIPDSYFAYVGGFEYTFNQVIASHDLSLILEYMGDSDVGTDTVDYRLFQNDLFIALRYSFNDTDSKEIMIGGFVDLEYPEEFLYLVEYTQRFKEEFTLAFRIDGVHTKQGSRLDIFKEDIRVKAKIQYNFGSD